MSCSIPWNEEHYRTVVEDVILSNWGSYITALEHQPLALYLRDKNKDKRYYMQIQESDTDGYVNYKNKEANGDIYTPSTEPADTDWVVLYDKGGTPLSIATLAQVSTTLYNSTTIPSEDELPSIDMSEWNNYSYVVDEKTWDYEETTERAWLGLFEPLHFSSADEGAVYNNEDLFVDDNAAASHYAMIRTRYTQYKYHKATYTNLDSGSQTFNTNLTKHSIYGYLVFDHDVLKNCISTWPADILDYSSFYPLKLQCCMNQIPSQADGSNYQDWNSQICEFYQAHGTDGACDEFMTNSWCIADSSGVIDRDKTECSCFVDYDYDEADNSNNTISALIKLLGIIDGDPGLDYSDCQSLVCWLGTCSDLGYKTQSMDEEKCPSLCANIVAVATGDYDIQTVTDITQTITCSGDTYNLTSDPDPDPDPETTGVDYQLIALLTGLGFTIAALVLALFWYLP
jgi:hypothetical protein